MASKKITAMPDLAGGQVPTDLLTAVDLSASLANQNVKSTLNDLFAEITKNITDLSVQFGNGAAATVSAAGKGKLIYNNSVQSFQASENGAAYQNLLKGSGTAQQVAFFTAAAALGGDTAFVWDSTNNRLGIGVTVAASVTSLNVRADGSAIAAEFLPNTVSDNPRVQIQVTSSDGRIGTSNATPSPFYIITNNTERISVESGGAVAINRTSPAQAQLHVDAATNVTTAFLANNAAGSSVEIAVFQVNGGNRALLTENGEWILGNASSVSGKLTLANSAGATLTSISAGNAASTLNYIFPVTDPTAGQFLQAAAPSGGNVTLSWATGSGSTSPAGSNTQVQFNSSGVFGASANLTWVSPTLTIGAATSATGLLTLANASGSTTTSLQAGNAAASLVYIFPTVSPTSGQVLTASAPSGANVTLSWATPTTGTVTGSGTATRVAFWSSASALSSNAALFWDNTNSRLGIGTATPDLPLDVVSDATALAQQWRETGAGTCRVQLQVPASFGQFGTTSNHAMGFIANGVQYVNIEPTGGTVFGSIIPATATVLINALVNTDTALIANNASGSTISIASFQVGGSLRHRFLSTGEAILGLASTVTGKLTLANSAGATLTSISAGNAASTLNFILPIADPTAGQVLSAAAPSGSDVVLSWVANGSGAPPTLTATQIGFGDGSNQLSGSTRLIWDNTNRTMTLGESGNAGSTFITLRSSNSASAFIAGSAAVAPGSQGGLLMANVGGDQTQGPGITWSDGNYNGTSRLYLSLGLNWQGYDTGGQALRLRKTTATSSQGDVVFEFRPNDGYLQINPFGTSAGNTTEIRFLELAASGTNYVALRGPDTVGATNPVIVLPSSSTPSTNDVLTVTGVSSGIITTAWQAGGGGGISGSGTTGALAKFTGATAIGDSIITESSTTITIAGRETINGLTVNTDANNTVASLTSNWSLTKNDTNTRNFYGALFQPTLNAGGANTATTVNVLAVNTTNTSLTGLTVNLLNLAFGGTEKFNVDSAGAITFASGVRQAFAPDATNPGLNVGVVSGDPSTPVDGDLWYDSTGNLLRARINSATVSLGAGGGSPGGSNTQIQYNNSSSFGGISTFTTDGTIVTFTPTVTTGSGSTAGVVGVANSLTTGNAFDFSSSSVTTGNVFSIAATGTAAASNTKTALRVATSGANGTSTQTTYGGRFTNTSTGTASTNVGLDVSASGGTNNFGLIVSGGQLLTQLGTQAAPGLVIGTAVTSTGFYGNGTRIQISIANVVGPLINGAGLYSKATGVIGWDSSADPANGTTDSAIGRNAAGRLEINNGTASAYRDLIVRQYYADQTITPGGTTGNQTINKSAGTVNIAAAGTTVTVTCSLCTTSSTIYTALRTNDATARIANVVPGAGSFVITLTAAATAEVSIGFLVVNQ